LGTQPADTANPKSKKQLKPACSEMATPVLLLFLRDFIYQQQLNYKIKKSIVVTATKNQ
jgi:hypothetical protein